MAGHTRLVTPHLGDRHAWRRRGGPGVGQQRRRATRFAFLLLVSLLATACRAEQAVPTGSRPPDTGVPRIAFPRQAPVEGVRTMMTAMLVGTLMERDGCLWVQSVFGEEPVLPIWPPEFLLQSEEGGLIVSDGQNVRVAVGDEVRMGGGHTPSVEGALLEQIPDACRGAYFVVGSGFGPNLIQDSDLFRLELLSPGQHATLGLYYLPQFWSQLQVAGPLSGTLVRYHHQRCIQLQTGNGPGPATLLWPEGWQVSAEAEGAVVRDARDNVVAQLGDSLSVNGRAVSQEWESVIYRRAVNELPADCCCTYFLVESAH
jgi:hypothetical protein